MTHFSIFFRIASLAFGLCIAGFHDSRQAVATEANPVRFNRDIRPIFSDNCYACHGPDRNKRKAGLRLDRKGDAYKQLDSGDFAVVPGDTSKSRLLELVSTDDDDDRMPPAKTGKRLTPTQIELLRKWVEQGAEWEDHWSYMPLTRPPLPKVANTSWPANPVDHFVLARLEREGLPPSDEVGRRALLRRLSFDLTGLPPTREAARRFLEDASDRAYERLVDRLLSSQHYGERMAAHWLDLVRYADTDGFHADNYRSVYPYRDYVIRAFNDNIPFDQFTIEQIAGDLLPNATLVQKTASTFNRLNRTTEEGGSQAKEYLAKYAADRVRTVSAIWLGTTMGCAECHDHKFDPFTTKDFYSLAAFFADVKEQGVGKPQGMILPNDDQAAQISQLDQRISRLASDLNAVTNRLEATQAHWEESLLEALNTGRFDWVPLKPIQFGAKSGSKLQLQEDLSLAAATVPSERDVYTVTSATDRKEITGFRLEVLPSSPDQEQSADDQRFLLSDVTVEVMSGRRITWEPVEISSASANSEQKRFPVASAIDDDPQSGWTPARKSESAHYRAAFVFAQPVPGGVGTVFKIGLKHGGKQQPAQVIRCFRLSLSTVPRPHHDERGISDGIVRILNTPAGKRAKDDALALLNYHIETDANAGRLRGRIGSLKNEKENLIKTIPTTLATVATTPRVMRVLPRGNWMDDSGEIIEPAAPESLAPSDAADLEKRLTRLDLARWLVSDENPLAARAFVNRLWKICFGTGLSRVLDDLGSQGEWPTHPPLLDWLAAEFRDSGWDVKRMVKLIAGSRTYRQSSAADPALRSRDPYNRLLARQSRFRLEAEMLRDNALAASGLLSGAIGGLSAKPYQPDGYWQHLNFPKRKYEEGSGGNLYRRGLYTFWCRTFLHPSLMAFDAPSREECTVNRVISNNPLQALVLLNDPTYVEAARVFAERTIRNGGTAIGDRFDWMFQTALTRAPTQSESARLAALYAKQFDRYADDKEAAARLIDVGEWETPKDLDPAELAAWTSIARVVFNLHEFITRY